MPSVTRFFLTYSWPLPLLAVLCCWLAHPPVHAWPLIVVGPAVWTLLIRLPKLPGRHPYRAIWGSSLLFWFGTIYWFVYPHPVLTLGLLAGAAYLALYLPLFIALCRHAVFQHSVKPLVIAPILWCGVEFLRKHVFGGFSLASLEHAWYRQPQLIGIADIGGEYLVGMLIMLLGVGLGCLIPLDYPTEIRRPPRLGYLGKRVRNRNRSFEPFLIGLAALAGTIAYSSLAERNATIAENAPENKTAPVRRFAALQGNVPIHLQMTEEMAADTCRQFVELSKQAAAAPERPDLIVWPETVFDRPFVEYEPGFQWDLEKLPPEERDAWNRLTPEEQQGSRQQHIDFHARQIHNVARHIGVPLLIGLSTARFSPDHGNKPLRLNSALLVDPALGVRERYDKIHLVMFGEYIPFSNWIPDDFPLRSLCPEAMVGKGYTSTPIPPLAAERKTGPKTGPLAAVNICFESTVPHFIRRQIIALRGRGEEPALLVNLSNDAWFPFTCEADQHLATMVFRAVEHRKPHITASNGGFAAVIDANGRIVAQGKRGAAEVVHAELRLVPRFSTYTKWGDMLAWACFFVLILIVFSATVVKKRKKRQPAESRKPQPGSGNS